MIVPTAANKPRTALLLLLLCYDCDENSCCAWMKGAGCSHPSLAGALSGGHYRL
jgi:hypothetical protein